MLTQTETYDASTGSWQTSPHIANGKSGKEPPEKRGLGWPERPAPEAYYGLAGDVVGAIEPYSEADPVALLAHELVSFGNLIGRQPHHVVDGEAHRTNLDVVFVGPTSKGRKGTAKAQISRLFEAVDSKWLADRVLGGLSSGEGLIWAVRDPIYSRERVPRSTEYQEILTDAGVEDKRLLVVETEFSSVLKMLLRQGNTLGEILRQAWDSGNLRSLTKNAPAKASGAHISLIGHITGDELLRCLSETDQANGFGNRFLWPAVRRSKYLPDYEDRRMDPTVLARLQDRIKDAVEFAGAVGEMRRDEQARQAWRRVYGGHGKPGLSDGRPGLMGAMLARAEAQVLRLSMIYALLDKSAVICLTHLKAALALWEYCERSARYIFGDALGDPTADTILQSLRNAPGGLTRTDISALFGRNKPAQDITRALGVLASLGLGTSSRGETDGRATERWTAL